MSDMRLTALCTGGCMVALFAAVWAIDRCEHAIRKLHADYRRVNGLDKD